ncbi:hypothetical protein K435DRAFT_796073 [Dendrothele bispora CBS 962.96]|uniref:C2 domain-containing protein n=1 Tax=Dendrothele bispora (strain CBS 962.96) TaxID=1314807 RepID=A0A4S8M6R2_DENBC|nr:hypothetical protein K435DRAFT_796073 [Dendrothele bispora CBS 962.96]
MISTNSEKGMPLQLKQTNDMEPPNLTIEGKIKGLYVLIKHGSDKYKTVKLDVTNAGAVQWDIQFKIKFSGMMELLAFELRRRRLFFKCIPGPSRLLGTFQIEICQFQGQGGSIESYRELKSPLQSASILIRPFSIMPTSQRPGRNCGCELCPTDIHLPWTQVTNNCNGNLGRWFVSDCPFFRWSDPRLTDPWWTTSPPLGGDWVHHISQAPTLPPSQVPPSESSQSSPPPYPSQVPPSSQLAGWAPSTSSVPHAEWLSSPPTTSHPNVQLTSCAVPECNSVPNARCDNGRCQKHCAELGGCKSVYKHRQASRNSSSPSPPSSVPLTSELSHPDMSKPPSAMSKPSATSKPPSTASKPPSATSTAPKPLPATSDVVSISMPTTALAREPQFFSRLHADAAEKRRQNEAKRAACRDEVNQGLESTRQFNSTVILMGWVEDAVEPTPFEVQGAVINGNFTVNEHILQRAGIEGTHFHYYRHGMGRFVAAEAPHVFKVINGDQFKLDGHPIILLRHPSVKNCAGIDAILQPTFRAPTKDTLTQPGMLSQRHKDLSTKLAALTITESRKPLSTSSRHNQSKRYISSSPSPPHALPKKARITSRSPTTPLSTATTPLSTTTTPPFTTTTPPSTAITPPSTAPSSMVPPASSSTAPSSTASPSSSTAFSPTAPPSTAHKRARSVISISSSSPSPSPQQNTHRSQLPKTEPCSPRIFRASSDSSIISISSSSSPPSPRVKNEPSDDEIDELDEDDEIQKRIWPDQYHAKAIANFIAASAALPRGKGQKTTQALFIETFPDAEIRDKKGWPKSTYFKHRKWWMSAPVEVRQKYIDVGESDEGLYLRFMAEVPAPDAELKSARQRVKRQKKRQQSIVEEESPEEEDDVEEYVPQKRIDKWVRVLSDSDD